MRLRLSASLALLSLLGLLTLSLATASARTGERGGKAERPRKDKNAKDVAAATDAGAEAGADEAGADDAADVPPTPPTLFDPARHMRVDEVRPGMTGYGLSVFQGTTIERFDVKVVSVLKNFNPKLDVILIRATGQNLEHTGAVAGMSGSPIFLVDDEGNERMIGAFAYGWPMSKDPVAGVQPIEYMLQAHVATSPTPDPEDAEDPAAADANAGDDAAEEDSPRRVGPRMQWSLTDVRLPWLDPATGASQTLAFPFDKNAAAQAQPLAGNVGGEGSINELAMRLQPLATPLMTGGVPQHLIEEFAPAFRALGMVPLQTGGGGGERLAKRAKARRAVEDAVAAEVEVAAEPAGPVTLEPGSVLAVPMLIGDADMTAVGTCTEVVGGRVFGFGHPFNNEGEVVLPMASGAVHDIIATITTSFKLGYMLDQQGKLTSDRAVGIAGDLGEAPPMVPIDLTVSYTDGSWQKSYHFDCAIHPRFTPLLGAMAMASAVTGANELPQYNTLEFDLKLEFANGQTIDVSNTAVNASGMDMLQLVGMPIMSAAENPFERVMVQRISGEVKVTPKALEAQILEVIVPRAKYQPGETVRAFLTYKPFRAEEQTMTVEMELPKDLPEGTYQLVISDWNRFMNDEQMTKSFRFTAETADEVFDVLRDFMAVRRNALYVRLVRQADGLAIGRTALPHLPGSRRQVMLGAGMSNTTRFISSTTKTIPTELVMNGAAEFAITIDKDVKVQVGKPQLAPGAGAGAGNDAAGGAAGGGTDASGGAGTGKPDASPPADGKAGDARGNDDDDADEAGE